MSQSRSRLRRALRPLALALSLLPGLAGAAELTVAAASNLQPALQDIAAGFEASSGHRVRFSFGSTGKHYAQIRHGAPFDAFLAADVEHPARLEKEGMAVADSRFTYAVGRLVLWSPRPGVVNEVGEVLRQGGFRRLSIASPRLAPYGQAAQQTLTALGVWDGVQSKLVQGENIGQAYQFVASGNAELGFVALSQVQRLGQAIEGSHWLVPEALHAPIAQQAVLLKDSPAAREFLAYLRSDAAQDVFRGYGYGRGER